MANHNSVKIHTGVFGILQDLHIKHRYQKNNEEGYSESKRVSQPIAEKLSEVQVVTRISGLEEISLHDLIGKLRSSNRFTVLQALDELRMRGKLSDDTLSWACLKYAKFQGANLSYTHLQNADLEKTDFQKANLSSANLKNARLVRANMQSTNLNNVSFEGANLLGANLLEAENCSYNQLALAGKLRWSILPEGQLYDGRLNLPGDFADAIVLHVDLSDPEEIAAFYGISVEEFVNGQEWYQANMPGASIWHQNINFQIAEIRMQWL